MRKGVKKKHISSRIECVYISLLFSQSGIAQLHITSFTLEVTAYHNGSFFVLLISPPSPMPKRHSVNSFSLAENLDLPVLS